MIFEELFPSHKQNRIKYHPEYEIIINDPLEITDEISQSMHEPIRETYPYMSLTESIEIIMNTRQQDK